MTNPARPTNPRRRLGGRSSARAPRRQRGIVMLFGLLALVIMLIGTVALVRSMQSSLTQSGNLGFKRDLTNQGDRALAAVLAQMQGAGTLVSEATRNSHLPAANYSATMLADNAQGVPLALIQDAAFAAVGVAGNDIAVADQGITIRYVVDRLCRGTGAPLADQCVMAGNPVPEGGSGSEQNSAEFDSAGGGSAVPAQVIYRVSVRVTGPRGTQSFFQSTLTL